MIKFQQGFAATGVYEEGYSEDLVNALLIGSALLVALGGCWAVAATAVRFCRGRIAAGTRKRGADKAGQETPVVLGRPKPKKKLLV